MSARSSRSNSAASASVRSTGSVDSTGTSRRPEGVEDRDTRQRPTLPFNRLRPRQATRASRRRAGSAAGMAHDVNVYMNGSGVFSANRLGRLRYHAPVPNPPYRDIVAEEIMTQAPKENPLSDRLIRHQPESLLYDYRDGTWQEDMAGDNFHRGRLDTYGWLPRTEKVYGRMYAGPSRTELEDRNAARLARNPAWRQLNVERPRLLAMEAMGPFLRDRRRFNVHMRAIREAAARSRRSMGGTPPGQGPLGTAPPMPTSGSDSDTSGSALAAYYRSSRSAKYHGSGRKRPSKRRPARQRASKVTARKPARRRRPG